jgi:hypothetical protein
MRSLTPHMIMARIADAEPSSPIAVFRNNDGTLDAKFAAPLRTAMEVDKRPDNLVGVFDRTMNQYDILAAMGYVTPSTGRKRGPKVKRGGYDIVQVPFTGAL